jgi:hypothetical protein
VDKQKSLLNKIEEWVREGLISNEQAEAIKQREKEIEIISPARRMKLNEILVYLGSLIIFLALAFFVILNWRKFGSMGRIFTVLIPTVLMFVLGWWLHGSKRARLRRGAQALWLVACLLSGLVFGVIFYEIGLLDVNRPGDPMILVSCLLATILAGTAFVLLPSITQSIAFHICGSAVLFSFIGWLDHILPPLNDFYEALGILVIGLVVGSLWLALSEWLQAREKKGLVIVSRIFGALTILFFSLISAMDKYPETWQKTVMEAIAFLASISFITASMKKQSQTFLYSGAAFLLFWITYINFEHFADRIGMPVTLLIIGVLLIGLGLGTERLSRLIRTSK